MIMKQLFRHITSLLRTALLLGAAILFNILPTQAQTAEQLAAMPNAFETIEDPNSVIGNGQYYYIQFYYNGPISYLTDCGLNKRAWTKDFLPSNNRLWTLERVGDGQFKLKSKDGNYLGYGRFDGFDRYGGVAEGNAIIFTFGQFKGGYYIKRADSDHVLYRNYNDEWADFPYGDGRDSQKYSGFMHFVQLKSNTAFIIYYRQEGVDNDNSVAETTRHYLTYSNTGNETDSRSNYDSWLWKDSKVSSRLSIIPKDKLLRTLPTLAAYHQDGLWALEDAGNGEFYIKRYGTEEYLNGVDAGGFYISDLGTKDATYGKYSLEDATANRYTRVMIKGVTTNSLAADQFYQWNYNTSDPATSTQNGSANAESHFNENLGSNALLIGWVNVQYSVYADLTGCTKMVIEGTPGMQLRVLLNRLEVGNGGGDENGGAITERNPVIGDDGKVELNLTEFSYVHLNAIKTGWSSSGTVSSVTLVSPNNSSSRHLNSAHGDGWYALQWRADDGDDWYAAFYPVEVPVPNKDEFYQVLVKWGDNMIDHAGRAIQCPTDPSDYDLWQLEMVDDYEHFRLKAPNGGYLKPGGTGVTPPNDPTDAEIMTNLKFWTDFSLTWFYVNPVVKEIQVDHYVRHRESYLRTYADDQVITDQQGLKKQGLARDIDSDWRNFTNDLDGMTQKTNHFVITHYIKKGNTKVIEFPTVLNRNNDHIYFQRFYNYKEVDEAMDLDNLKAHVSLDTRDDGDVQYFLYRNGMVTGQKLKWKYNDGTDIPDGGLARNEQRRFNFTNSDGNRFTVGVDVSRYSDLEYLNTGDLKEPSLTMRYLFQMRDAKEMAAQLTACSEGSENWLEQKEFHFGRTQVPYTKFKKVGYRGEFIPIYHVFSDYWVYDDPRYLKKEDNKVVIDKAYINDNYLHKDINAITDEELNAFLDDHLVSAVNDNSSGKIEVVVDPGNTGIRRGGYNPNLNLNDQDYNDNNESDADELNYQGFYFYDKLSPNTKTEYGNSRFIVFRYPKADANGIVQVANCGPQNPAYIRVYLNNNGTRYQIAKFTLIFDANMATRPWTEIKNGTSYANGINKVKNTDRDPRKLREKAGLPIAKVTFDYPQNTTYHFPVGSETKHNNGWGDDDGGGHTIENSSPLPLTFDHTNYAFDGDGCNWGSYTLVTEKTTDWGNQKHIAPADDATHGYNIDADPGMQKAFMYIDASEQPGDICAVEFEGEFCANDQLMCTGWISGSNKIQNDTRCPGSITLTVKGEDKNGNKKDIYRFCPGQIYELDNGYGDNGVGDATAAENAAGIDGNGNNADYVVWQQFYFEFSTKEKFERYWLEVNNNCVSSNGGDFMLDNVEVYTIVPEVEPDINTPLCVSRDGDNINYDMRFLKLDVDYNKLLSSRIKDEQTSSQTVSATPYLGLVFLEKETFLKTLRDGLGETNVSLEKMAERVESGYYDATIDGGDYRYQNAFNAALLRSNNSTAIWKSNAPATNMGAGVMYFQWDKTFENNPEYSFDKAVNRNGTVFRYIDNKGTTDDEADDVKYLIFNGNYPQLPWKTNTEYYIVPSNTVIEDYTSVYDAFNICSNCGKASTFQIEPPYEVLGLESSESSEDQLVCEGQIPTIVLNLKGYDLKGNPVKMEDLNYDWWLGKKGYKIDNQEVPPVLATLLNYHQQEKYGVKLDEALSIFRSYYPYLTSLDGVTIKDGTPSLSQPMIDYLKDLVATGELVLHQSSVSVPAESASNDDPYFYLVACPIHDEAFNQALHPQENQYVAYFCDEPQGIRIKVGLKAPTLKSGFVPGEHNFDSYDYQFPAGTDPVLSIRLAKKEQFETVKNGSEEGATPSTSVNHLWLPIRNAKTQGANYVVTKEKDATTKDDNIYLASTNDPTWDKKISKEMRDHGLLPIVGRIVKLKAINIKDNSEGAAADATINEADQDTYNRLCIYFTENFDVREGYNYTLSMPFQEDVKSNSCDGTILINLKIVPDYEVWTGAAGNTDWNNDENWRRADGNTTDNSGVNGDELYVASAANTSPLYDYTTNKVNYRSPKDRIFRKGFAPLYCTHILMKSDEWGNAPVLYDAIDGHAEITETGSRLINSPFPNLRDADGWDGNTDTKATATAILKFDMQARRYDMWKDTYGTDPDRGQKDGDLIAEMYQINSCDEIAMQAGTELRNAHLLNYNSAWMEFELETKRWYLLGSPLQGTISGEWYAPTGNLPQQKTTYYDNVTFGSGYDRYSPAIYQRSWDKAKAVLYEVGANYATNDDAQTNEYDNASQGSWNTTWQAPTGGADDYLDRLGYKPFGAKKANVAIKGIWSNTYNDAQVDYATGGFSVMVMNHLKGHAADVKAIVRLPKEDKMYDYYKFSEDGSDDGGTDTNISEVQTKDRADYTKRATNRGRLKTDLLLPTQDGIQKQEKLQTDPSKYRYGDRRTLTRIPIKEQELTAMNDETFSFTEKVAAGATNLGYYLIENPFPCGLDMTKFFENTDNSSVLNTKYWILTKGNGQNPRQQLVQQAGTEWVSTTDEPVVYPNPNYVEGESQESEKNLTFYPNAVLAPGQGFFVQAKTGVIGDIDITFTDDMQAQSRFGVIDGNGRKFTYVIGQSQRTKKMYDANDDGIPDTEVTGNYEEGDIIIVDHDNNPETPDIPKTVVLVPQYTEQADPDNPEQTIKIPVLDDIEETVTLYNYKQEELDGTHNKEYPLRTRGEGAMANLPGLVITAERDNSQSSALVMQRSNTSNDFLPEEDTETFINSDLVNAPTVYTLCGRLATTINTVHDFRSLSIGVESTSEAPCTLTFRGVEMLGDSIAFYDALEKTLTPLESGMQFSVSGQTQNRYYLVRSLNQKEAAEETHLQIFTEGLTARVIASTDEPITSVRCYDTSGRLICSAEPHTSEYNFTLQRAGVYIIEAQTENDRKTKKVLAK